MKQCKKENKIKTDGNLKQDNKYTFHKIYDLTGRVYL